MRWEWLSRTRTFSGGVLNSCASYPQSRADVFLAKKEITFAKVKVHKFFYQLNANAVLEPTISLN